jgi:hypothetical protein
VIKVFLSLENEIEVFYLYFKLILSIWNTKNETIINKCSYINDHWNKDACTICDNIIYEKQNQQRKAGGVQCTQPQHDPATLDNRQGAL